MGKVKTDHRLSGVNDQGIILRRSKKNEPFYLQDGGCIRQGMLWHAGENYYITYDGFMPQDTEESWVRNCIAKSRDLLHWEKLGAQLNPTSLDRPCINLNDYADSTCACSPWFFEEDGIWHMYYVGSRTPGEVPGTPYTALVATSNSFEGPWHKINDQPAKNRHVCFPLRNNTYYSDTACSGYVLINPKWQGKGDACNMKYLMFFSGAAYTPELARTIGIARTNDLLATDDYDKDNGNFWSIDPIPMIPPEHDVENSSIYYESESRTYFLFTNHIDETNCYTDAIWVYWTKDLDCLNPANRAIVLDKNNTKEVKGAIGMPSVMKLDEKTLAMTYDGAAGCDFTHLNRDIGLAYIQLPVSHSLPT